MSRVDKLREVIDNEKSTQVKEYLKQLNLDDPIIDFLINTKKYITNINTDIDLNAIENFTNNFSLNN